jgi:hypothetical protein
MANKITTLRTFNADAAIDALSIAPRLSARAKVELVAAALDAEEEIPHMVMRHNERTVAALVRKGLLVSFDADPGVDATLTEAGAAVAAMYRSAVLSGEIAA